MKTKSLKAKSLKAKFCQCSQRTTARILQERKYGAALGLASLLCAGMALAQTSTNSPASTNSPSANSTNVTKLEKVTVVEKLDIAREEIVPSLGATSYTIDKEQIKTLPQGETTRFNEVLLHT